MNRFPSLASSAKATPLIRNKTNLPPAQELQRRMKAMSERATKYMESRGYETQQRNGQRISVLINSDLQLDSSGQTEVFVGKVPRELFEDELLPLMEKAGPVYMLRLMMDFSGTNRGFFFAKYFTAAHATYACQNLSGTYLRPDVEYPIGIKPSFDNKSLFFWNLPPKLTRERLLKELRKNLEGVVDARLPEISKNSANSRHAFVDFQTHDHATQARRILVPGDIKVFNRNILVDWARPESNQVSGQPNQQMTAALINSSNSISPNLSLLHVPNSLSNQATNSSTAAQQINSNESSLFDNLLLSPLPPYQQLSSVSPSNNVIGNQSCLSRSSNLLDYAEPLKISTGPILGLRAQELLDSCPPDQSRVITVGNIRPIYADICKLKNLFELNGRFQIVNIMPSGVGSLSIEYSTYEQAQLMMEAIILMPDCFSKLAVPNHNITAYWGSMVDMNSYNRMPFSYQRQTLMTK